ncbi:MAG: hypothetical protein NT030_07940 [Candidatus Saganbacteria bacterium]|nr:hypothetical protein [Candidatus Saganbacteria bacterium]
MAIDFGNPLPKGTELKDKFIKQKAKELTQFGGDLGEAIGGQTLDDPEGKRSEGISPLELWTGYRRPEPKLDWFKVAKKLFGDKVKEAPGVIVNHLHTESVPNTPSGVPLPKEK